MTLNNPKPGFGSSAEYQVSGLPWVTASVATTTPWKYEFSKVTRFVMLQNKASAGTYIRIAFTENGANLNNYYAVNGGESVHMEVRVKEVYIRSDAGTPAYTLMAGLTTIDAVQMPSLTGSLGGNIIWDGVG